MLYGLSEKDFQFLNENLVRPLKNKKAKVFLFGSRATGKHQKFSDVDLYYIESETEPVHSRIISQIITLFEDSRFPYKIDLVNYKNIAKSYLAGVDLVRVELE